jgi:hypothetical protein
MIVVPFKDFIPPPRYDNKPFTSIRIEEGPTDLGAWTTLATIALVPTDTDPTNPMPRSFSIENATLEQGWYRLTWLDVDGDMTQPLDPIHNVPVETFDFLPSVGQVADYIRARTKDNLGNEIGTFTNQTRPTAQAVESIIQKAASDLALILDTDIPGEMNGQVADLIALGAALRVEISYFPEQVGTDKTAYAELKELYDDMLERVQIALAREQAELETGDEGASGHVAFGFPIAEALWDKKM